MHNTISYLRNGAADAMDWNAYLAFTEQQVSSGRTSGVTQTEYLIEMSKLNLVRMNRLRKTVQLCEKLSGMATTLQPQTWVVFTEIWCGDAAQNIPVFRAIEEASMGNVTLKLVLRDEHEEMINEHLTNGSKSIPKLIAFDDDLNHIFSWGPRPEALQQLVIDYKLMPEPKRSYTDFSAEIQKWYAVDRTNTIQREFIQLFEQLIFRELD